jgi:hypothetical protein
VNIVDRFAGWVANCGLGTRIERFADLIGITMVRSNGVMLERAQACCRMEADLRQRHD